MQRSGIAWQICIMYCVYSFACACVAEQGDCLHIVCMYTNACASHKLTVTGDHGASSCEAATRTSIIALLLARASGLTSSVVICA